MTKCTFVLYEMYYRDFRIATIIFSYYNKVVKLYCNIKLNYSFI